MWHQKQCNLHLKMFFYLTKLINQRSKFTHVKWPSHMHVNKPSFNANHTLFVCLSHMFCLLRPKHLQHIMMMTDKCVCVCVWKRGRTLMWKDWLKRDKGHCWGLRLKSTPLICECVWLCVLDRWLTLTLSECCVTLTPLSLWLSVCVCVCVHVTHWLVRALGTLKWHLSLPLSLLWFSSFFSIFVVVVSLFSGILNPEWELMITVVKQSQLITNSISSPTKR